MKKILTVIAVVILMVGCNKKPVQKNLRKHIYYTYVGIVDMDTVQDVFADSIGDKYYRVEYLEKDSFYWQNKWFYEEGPIITYFCPKTKKYYRTFPDNNGDMIGVDIDPYHNMDWLNN